jgi:hypothetical protein
MAKFGIAPAQPAQDRRRGSHLPMNIVFLMYTSAACVLTYIRDAIAQDRAQTSEKPGAHWRGEIQRAPGLTIDQIIVRRQTGARTPNGVSLYAGWLLSRVFGAGQSAKGRSPVPWGL